MGGRIEKLLAEKKIELPKAAIPVANYVPVVVAGNLAFVAGQVTVWNGEFKFIGKLGKEYTVEQGQQAIPNSAAFSSSELCRSVLCPEETFLPTGKRERKAVRKDNEECFKIGRAHV